MSTKSATDYMSNGPMCNARKSVQCSMRDDLHIRYKANCVAMAAWSAGVMPSAL
jgi:hypothetical protein